MEALGAILIIIGFLFGSFLDVAILSTPGAFIRWMISGRKNSFKEFYKKRLFMNYFLGLTTVLVLYIVIILFVKLFT